MRVVIFGAGAIGCWLGAGLRQAGVEVSFLTRGASLQTLKSVGLTVEEGEERRTYQVEASDDPQAHSGAEFVVVALKGQDVAGASETLSTLAQGPSTVLTIQNGLPWWFLGNEPLHSVDPGGKLLKSIPRSAAIGGVVHASTQLLGPAHVRINKVDRLMLGEASGGTSHRVAGLVAQFSAGGIPAVASPDIRRELWAKLWGNMNMNPISALTRSGAADILANPLLRELIRGMMREMEAIGQRLGIELPMSIDERIGVTERLGNFRTSMLQDLELGRQLEIEPILGVVVELAQKVAVDTPLSRAVLGLARQIPQPALR